MYIKIDGVICRENNVKQIEKHPLYSLDINYIIKYILYTPKYTNIH
jgi:hypothetical protein